MSIKARTRITTTTANISIRVKRFISASGVCGLFGLIGLKAGRLEGHASIMPHSVGIVIGFYHMKSSFFVVITDK